MKRLLLGLLAGAAIFAATQPAKAVLLGNAGFEWDASNATILTVDPTVPAGNQVQNIPCIICANNQPQQPTGFGYNQFGNNGNQNTTVSFFSTAVVPPGPGSGLAIDQYAGATGYTIGTTGSNPFLTAVGGRISFQIGIDVNDTGVAQTLESFWFLNVTQKTVLAVFSPEPGVGQLLPNIHNGTGFPDWTINGLTLAGINPNDTIMFFARITGANDGPDSFFLISNLAAETPIPPTAMLFGSVIAGGIGLRAIRNRRRKA